MNCLATTRIILVAAMGIICTQQIVTLLYSFFASESWTMYTRYKDMGKLTLPDISICNYNQVNATLASEIGINEESLQSIITGTKLENEWKELSELMKGSITLEDVLLRSIAMGNSFKDGLISYKNIAYIYKLDMFRLEIFGRFNFYLTRSLAHSCLVSVANCFTGSTSWKCCEKSEQVIKHGKVCTKLNPGLRIQDAMGSSSGYRILYELHTDSYESSIIDVDFDSGLTVELSYENNVSVGVNVPPSSNALIKIEPIEDLVVDSGMLDKSFYPAPCQTIDSAGQAYTNMQHCQRECISAWHYSLCGCVTTGFGTNFSRVCEIDQNLECRIKRMLGLYGLQRYGGYTALSKEYQGEMWSVFGGCWVTCARPCRQTRISTSVSTTQFGTIEQMTRLHAFMNRQSGRNITMDYMLRNYISLHIYFDNFAIQQNILYPVVTLNRLMSMIGGQLGLWVGASMVTLINLIPRLGYAAVSQEHKRSDHPNRFDIK